MLCLIAAATVSVLATSPDQVKTFEQWWAEGISNARSNAMLAGYGAEFTFAFTYAMPPEGLDALRESIKNKPDHPAWFQIERLEKQQREGAALQHVRIWRDSTGLLARVSYTSDQNTWIDASTRADGGWMLFETTLTLKPGDPKVGSGKMQQYVDGYRAHIRGLLAGGFEPLENGGAAPSQPPLLSQRGEWSGRWSGERNGYKNTVTAKGSFDTASGKGKIIEVTFEAAQDGKPTSKNVTTYDDWRATELGAIPHRSVTTLQNDGHKLEARLSKVFPVTDADVASLAADPSPERPDPIRGNLRFTRIKNERNGDTRAFDTKDAAVPNSALAPSPIASRSQGLVIAGWSLAAVIVGFLVWSFLRRR